MNIGGREVKNCPRCGKVFMRVARNLCPDCIREEEAEIDEVRHYLHDHRGASLAEVVENTGASEELVLRLIREGRVIVSENGITIKCERCGRTITEGRFCNLCKMELAKGLNIAVSTSTRNDSVKTTGYHVETKKNPRSND